MTKAPRSKTPASKASKRRLRQSEVEFKARVRMYRQGIGDCLLISLPRTDASGHFHVLIDCGVLLGTPDAKGWMQRIVADIAKTTDGKIDLLVVTHEHWDHLSGFLDAAEELAAIDFGDVWMSWAENPDDPQAQELERARDQAIRALRIAEARLALAEDPEAQPLADLMSLFGSRGRTTREALKDARALAPDKTPRYLEPGQTLSLGETGARVHVLGPPRDEALLRRSNPRQGEGYGLAPGLPVDEMLALMGAKPADGKDDAGSETAANAIPTDRPHDGPFAARWGIPLAVARTLPFFARTIDAPDQAWRRIDLAWLDGALDLALRLDRDTNNSSLVLAVELPEGEVLLMAADAQAGNWLSWRALDFDGVTGPELLARTVLYKVGHHGSHNATLRADGLEQMKELKTALVPVDESVAHARNWTRIPLPELLDALHKRTGGRVLRADKPPPEGLDDIEASALYFDILI